MLTREIVEAAKTDYVLHATRLYTCPIIEDAYATVHGGHCDSPRALGAGNDWSLFWAGTRGRNSYWLDAIDDEGSFEESRAFRLEMFDAFLSNDDERIDRLRRRIRGIDT